VMCAHNFCLTELGAHVVLLGFLGTIGCAIAG